MKTRVSSGAKAPPAAFPASPDRIKGRNHEPKDFSTPAEVCTWEKL
jgi:hypothetical protein